MKGTVWDFDIDENIFEYIRNSKACSDVIEDKYVNVEIYMDET